MNPFHWSLHWSQHNACNWQLDTERGDRPGGPLVSTITLVAYFITINSEASVMILKLNFKEFSQVLMMKYSEHCT